MNPSQSIRPLSVGNVVSASIRLLRSHLGQFFGISLKAIGWMLIPGILTLLIFTVFATAWMTIASPTSRSNPGGLIAFGVLMVPVFLAVAIFCSAKALTNEALISRLAFQDLMGQPESTAVAWQQIRKRTWHFWLARVIVVIILVLLSFAFGLLRDLLMLIPNSLSRAGGDSQAMVMLGMLIATVIMLVNYVFQLWFQAKFFVPELSIALEQNVSGFDSIGRSWELSKGHAVRISMVLLVAGLITVPLFALAFAPFIVTILASIASMSGSRGVPDPAALGAIFGSLGLGVLLTFVFSIFTTPFWQTIKAVVYYDLRSRREGMGLELRER